MTPADLFVDSPLGRDVHAAVHDVLSGSGEVEVRTTASQVAFRRRRGFAYLWLPGRYLSRPAAEVVLSIALDRELRSPRFKEVVHPSRRTWMHHLEIADADDVDDEVQGWLREAYDAAG